MPFLKVQTNANIEGPAEKALVEEATAVLSKLLGKPEEYIMILIEPDLKLSFGGSDANCAFVELRSLGLQESDGARLSEAICKLMKDHLYLPGDRVYVMMADHPRSLWGYDGRTF